MRPHHIYYSTIYFYIPISYGHSSSGSVHFVKWCTWIYSTIPLLMAIMLFPFFMPLYIILLYIPYMLVLLILQNIFPTVRMRSQKEGVFKVSRTTSRIEKVQTIHIPTRSVWGYSPILNANNLFSFYFIIGRVKIFYYDINGHIFDS